MLWIKIETVEVERVCTMPILPMLNRLLKDITVSLTVDGIVADYELAKTMTFTKVDDCIMYFVMRASIMLPSF